MSAQAPAMWQAGTGEIVATRHHDDDRQWITIERADPRVLIAAELFDMFDPAAVTVTRATEDTLIGATVKFTAENGRWIYRITGQLFARDCYVAEWPD